MGLTVRPVFARQIPLLDRRQKRYFRDDLFLSHILGHEGPDSILADLRRRGLATGLGAGSACDTDQFRTFDVSCPINTERSKGVAQVSWRRYGARRSVYKPSSGPPITSRRQRGWSHRVSVGCGVVIVASMAVTLDAIEQTQRRIYTQVGQTPDAANFATRSPGKLQVGHLGRFGRFAGSLALDRTPRDASTDERRKSVLELLREMNTNLPLVTHSGASR